MSHDNTLSVSSFKHNLCDNFKNILLYSAQMELKDRFKAARRHRGLSQADLATESHSSQMMISKIERGLTVQPRRIEKFAKIFGVSPEWLLYGANPPPWALEAREGESSYAVEMYQVPLVSWVQAGDFCNPDARHDYEDYEMIVCPEKSVSEKAFALRVVGDSMTSPFGRSYPEGTIIFIDPHRGAQPGQRVVARTEKGHTFKELAMNEFGEHYLKPLNPSHQPIFGPGIEICGVVVGSYNPE